MSLLKSQLVQISSIHHRPLTMTYIHTNHGDSNHNNQNVKLGCITSPWLANLQPRPTNKTQMNNQELQRRKVAQGIARVRENVHIFMVRIDNRHTYLKESGFEAEGFAAATSGLSGGTAACIPWVLPPRVTVHIRVPIKGYI